MAGPSSQETREIDIILTFDDGPHAAEASGNFTDRALDVLADNPIHDGIKAVFFIQSHVRDRVTDNYYRGNTPQGRRVLRLAINAGHLVEVHTGYDDWRAHELTHVQRLTQPTGDDFEGGLPQDLTQCKNFINGLIASYAGTQFVRPVEGVHNGTVRRKYSDADLKMTMWDVDSRDAISGETPTTIRNNLRTGIQSKLEEGLTRLVILFHETSAHTRHNQGLCVTE